MPQKKGNIPLINGKIPDDQPNENLENRVKRPVDLLFGSGARVDVLWCLMNHPDIGLEQSEIMHATGRSIKDVKRALDILQDLGLVVKLNGLGNQPVLPTAYLPLVESSQGDEEQFRKYGRTRYHLIQNHPWIPSLRMLLECSIGSVDVIRNGLRRVQGNYIAFVFGSYATSEQTALSDIDLMVIGDHDQSKLIDEIYELEKKIGREIQVISYRSDEWRNAVRERRHFVVSLMEAPKIFLRGNAQELADLALSIKK